MCEVDELGLADARRGPLEEDALVLSCGRRVPSLARRGG